MSANLSSAASKPSSRAPPRAAAGRSDAAGRMTGGVVVAVLFMGSTLLTPLYDLYRSAYGFSALVLVLLYAVYVVGNLAALLLFGRLSDQIGRKPVVFAGLGLAAVSTVLFLVDADPAWLFAGRVASGCAVGIGAGAATAWIGEFTPKDRLAGAASTMTAFNFAGLALGPLVAGGLVQYAPQPLRLSFIVYLVVLAAVAALVAVTRETLATRALLSLKPKLRVPPGARLAFIAPAATGFAAMALVGFFAALGPTTIRQDLHLANRAASGALVAELFVIAAVAILATRRLAARPAMLIGLAATPVGLALLIAAQRLESLPLLMVGNAVCGVAAALGYRGGLAVANSLAPAERRAEVASAYFICCFLGNAIPVIGAGALSQMSSARFADLVFAGVVSAIALGAITASLAFGKAEPAA
jgi:MFS family permease